MKTVQICLLLLLVLSACGTDGATDRQDTASTTETITTETDQASLETPAEVAAGSSFEVSWTGPANEDDYVTIVEEGAQQGTYGDYTYTREGSPLSLRAPDTPGTYEIRYVDNDSKEVLVSAPITVTDVQASLETPSEIGAGSTFEVTWTGPDTDDDYVTIVEQGADVGTYGDYTYTREGSPASLTAPEAPGDYEVRYVMGQSKRVLAGEPIQVTEVTADLNVPEEVQIEAPIEITWTGPANEDDYVTIVEAGAPEGTYGDYTYTREGSPLTLQAPETPGLYEVRYVTGQTTQTLARASVTVRPLSATLDAPDAVAPGASFSVAWTGPNNPEDFLAVAQTDAPATTYESRAYSRAGNPATLFAPSAPGTYEVRYVLADVDSILASRPLNVSANSSAQ